MFIVIGFNDEVKAQIECFMQKIESGIWACTQCDYSGNKKQVYRHVDSIHISTTYICNICGQDSPTQNALAVHMKRKH